MSKKIKVAVLGASGYTGSEFVRLSLRHPMIELAALSANAQAGNAYHQVFPNFLGVGLPSLVTVEEIDFSVIDVAVFCLPHTKSQEIVARLWNDYPNLKFIDLAADFRFSDPKIYSEVYVPHLTPDLQSHAVYGLTEHNRVAIQNARLVACPGCFPTGSLSVILPLAKAGMIEQDGMIVDSKTGVTGAGRKASQSFLFGEVNESVHAYGLSGHRHRPEIEQEVSKAMGASVAITFIPHLVGKSRGIVTTAYLQLKDGTSFDKARQILMTLAQQETMLHYSDDSAYISSRFVRGTNRVVFGIFPGRTNKDIIGVSAIDNLTKGSSGQALQNLNLMFNLDEDIGLNAVSIFP